MNNFTEPKWRIVGDLKLQYCCTDAVYGLIKKIDEKFEWEARMTRHYGLGQGLSLDLEHAQKCVELLIKGTKSDLKSQIEEQERNK